MTRPPRWYHRPSWLAVWIGLLGPFALPLIWSSPNLKQPVKWMISIGVLALTVWMVSMAIQIGVLTLNRLKEYPDLRRLLGTIFLR